MPVLSQPGSPGVGAWHANQHIRTDQSLWEIAHTQRCPESNPSTTNFLTFGRRCLLAVSHLPVHVLLT